MQWPPEEAIDKGTTPSKRKQARRNDRCLSGSAKLKDDCSGAAVERVALGNQTAAQAGSALPQYSLLSTTRLRTP